MDDAPAPRRRGRPPGSRNRPVPTGAVPLDDYKHPDPDALISRMMGLVDGAQRAIRSEVAASPQEAGSLVTVTKLEKLSATLVRAMAALQKSADIAEEMACRMSPEQLLDAAIAKIEGQDLTTLSYAIRRLRAHRDRLSPVKTVQVDDTAPATDALASLE